MTRVSENSTASALQYSLGKTKTRMEDLQLKGTNLRSLQKPSDDPIASTEALSIRSKKVDADQFSRNTLIARTQLEFTENALTDLSEVLMRAKELAVGQSSEVYNADARRGVAQEIAQLKNQSVAILNRQFGPKYIFAGTKTLTRPFSETGDYSGNDQVVRVEIAKDHFVPMNIPGSLLLDPRKRELPPAQQQPGNLESSPGTPPVASPERSLASNPSHHQDQQQQVAKPVTAIIADLQTFQSALMNNNPKTIQTLLTHLDESYNAIVEMRTKVGSYINSIDGSTQQTERDLLLQQSYLSSIEDADVMDLFSDLQKQRAILDATYRSGSNMLDKNLLQYLN